MRVFTIGHSTRTTEQLVEALRAHGIELLADVRSFPRSRHVPHFNREALEVDLPTAGIDYLHLPELGGRRQPRKDSPNLAWRNEGFRGFADYMLTLEFEAGLAHLLELAAERETAIMCAEAVYKRCHRSLIADALTLRGHEVLHIATPRRVEPHQLTPFARVEDGRLLYPALL
ncbi:MAG TPA: DUF488 domain-containing protein [Dehalococcoidia bacterium]|nr:DUF488 domain-containing protein [Dehalococcoidia bacterium]